MKKTVALLLCLLTIFSVFSFDIKAVYDESGKILSQINEAKQENTDTSIEYAKNENEFASLAVELVEENFEESYFSSIIIDADNNTITSDGVENENCDVQILSAADGKLDSENSEIAIYSVLQSHSAQDEFEHIIESSDSVSESVNVSDNDFEKVSKYITLKDLKKQGYEIEKGEGNTLVITRPFQTKRLIVRTKGNAQPEILAGATDVISDSCGRYIIQFETIEDTMSAFEHYSNSSICESVSADKVVTTAASKGSIIEERGFNRWGSKRSETDRFISHLEANGKSSQVVVAVIDTGIASFHELLSGRIASGGYDFVNGDSTPYDDNGHGSHVSGIIADNTPSTVKILPLKCFSSIGESTDIIISLGIEKAIASKVNVINMSFGSVCFDDNCEVKSSVEKAIKAGIVCISAAGNESENADNCCPANIQGCITVSSVGEQDGFSSFSNYGNCIDIAAPGEEILSSVPDVMGSYAYLSGTSMAAPFVSAAAAMLLIENPSLTVSKLEKALKKAVVDAGIKGDDIYYGAGILDFGVYLGDKKSAKSITLSTNSVTANASKYVKKPLQEITVTVEPFDATDKSYTVSYSKSGVAAFDGMGMYGISPGETKASFKTSNGKTAVCTVKSEKSDLWIDYAASAYASGKGTQKQPYIISTAAQLAKISLDSYNLKLSNNTYFKLNKNIDLAGKIWYPISGLDRNGFALRINLDGNGYSISNMTINKYNHGVFAMEAGLFVNNSGEIKNLDLKKVNINLPSAQIVGAFAANFSGYMKNCYASGTVKGLVAGGLIGSLMQTYSNSYSIGISNCRSDINVKGVDVSGGICATMLGGTVNNCIFGGKLSVSNKSTGISGGICAVLSCSNAVNDYNGSNIQHSLVVNCISTANIIGAKMGLSDTTGIYKATVKNCYYSGNYSSVADVNFDGDKLNGEKVNLQKFTDKRFFTSSSLWAEDYKWNFSSLWKTSSTLPTFNSRKEKTKTSEFDYVDLGNEISVSGYSGSSTTAQIPSEIDSKPVRYIESCFSAKNAKVNTIIIPDSVKIISSSAFCKEDLPYLKKVTLGKNVTTIAPKAFDGVGIEYLTFPVSIDIICASAFFECVSLKYVVFTSGVGSHFSKNAFLFANTPKSLSVGYPSGKVGWLITRFNNAVCERYTSGKAYKIYAPNITSLKVGKATALDAVVLPEGLKVGITYSVNDSSMASVSNGKITPKKKGTVKVTFKTSDGACKLTKSYTTNSYAPYTIVYDGNGASSTESYTQSLPYETSTALTANKFKKTGYTFIGWSTSKTGEVKYTDKQKVKKVAAAGGKKTLYAVWKANTYTVKFNANGGSGKMNAQSFTYDTKKALSKNTFKAPKGKVFAGWSKTKVGTACYENKQKISNLTAKNKGTVTLYAVWVKPKTYKITYVLNGGKIPTEYKTSYKSGTGYTLPVPKRSGYSFVGWYTNKTFTSGKISVIKPWKTGDIKVYAKWKKK